MNSKVNEAREYFMKNFEGSIEGQGGDKNAYIGACILVKDYGLDFDTSLGILEQWNSKCSPRFTREELKQKLKNAGAYGKESIKKPAPLVTDSAISKLMQIAREVEVFLGTDHIAYGRFKIDGREETHPINSQKFCYYLVSEYTSRNDKPPSSSIDQVVQYLHARAWRNGLFKEVGYRVRTCEGSEGCDLTFYDLVDRDWTQVEIGPDGWRLRDDQPEHFKRTQPAKALPPPSREGDYNILFKYVNIKDTNDKLLCLTWMLHTIVTNGPYALLVLQGQQGSAKTSSTRAIKNVLDPSIPAIRSAPKEEQSLAAAAQNTWVLSVDNLSGLPAWLSDSLCRLSTGGGICSRALYTNGEEYAFEGKRPILLNGIDDIVSRPDLLDRSVVLNLPTIPNNKRRTESEIERAFENDRSIILGGLFDLAVGVKKLLPGIELTSKPRLADFAEVGVALEQVLNLNEGSFLQAFEENRRQAIQSEGSQNLTVQSLMAVSKGNGGWWDGSMTDLLKECTRVASSLYPGERTTKYFPQTPRKLKSELIRLKPILEEYGFEVDFPGREGGTGRSTVSISQINSGVNISDTQQGWDF